MGSALVNPKIISWAKDRAGFTTADLVAKIHKKFHLWEQGEDAPTFKQAKMLAKKLNIPFGYLYLKKPPVEEDPAPDLRSRADIYQGEFSTELRAAVNAAISKQAWYKDYLLEIDASELEFIDKFTLSDNPKMIAEDMTKTLNISVARRQKKSRTEVLRYFVTQAEELGILIMRSGKLGNNTRRIFNNDEFLGFALPDKLAPVIFINTQDYLASQIFTFVHELAHLWVGSKGISNFNIGTNRQYSKIELFCNQVAAQVLVPGDELRARYDSGSSLADNAQELVRIFKVSNIVIARCALNYKLCSQEDFFEYYQYLRVIWARQDRIKQEKESTGGSFYNNLIAANSKIFTDFVFRQVKSGTMLYRDAANLLETTPAVIDKYAERAGIK